MRKRPQYAPALTPLGMTIDAAVVIFHRCARIARGGVDSLIESQLMVTEKLEALAVVWWSSMTGAYGRSPRSVARGVFTHYARGVRSNRKRLAG